MPQSHQPVMHLYRGAPASRSWSKYHETITEWTLCGMERKRHLPPPATGNPGQVTCEYCLNLMAPKSYDHTQKAFTPSAAGRGDLRELAPVDELLSGIAETHRVAIKRDEIGDPVIPGHYGHIYTDDGQVMICFTGDGRDELAAKLFKTLRLKALRPHLAKIKQEGDFEFIAELNPTHAAIRTALFQVLRVRRFKVTKGIPRDMSHLNGPRPNPDSKLSE